MSNVPAFALPRRISIPMMTEMLIDCLVEDELPKPVTLEENEMDISPEKTESSDTAELKGPRPPPANSRRMQRRRPSMDVIHEVASKICGVIDKLAEKVSTILEGGSTSPS